MTTAKEVKVLGDTTEDGESDVSRDKRSFPKVLNDWGGGDDVAWCQEHLRSRDCT